MLIFISIARAAPPAGGLVFEWHTLSKAIGPDVSQKPDSDMESPMPWGADARDLDGSASDLSRDVVRKGTRSTISSAKLILFCMVRAIK